MSQGMPISVSQVAAVSVPELPSQLSVLGPPINASSPLPAAIVSSPAMPSRRLARRLPVIVSLNGEPIRFSTVLNVASVNSRTEIGGQA